MIIVRIRDKHPSSNAILGAAIIFVVPAFLYWSIHGLQFDEKDWLRVGGCGFLAAMAAWARCQPVPPAIICLAAYVALAGLQLYLGAPNLFIVGMVLGATLLLLLIALFSAAMEK